ncbi:hypothetical protein A6R68_17037, partial [Neotoma lepida]
MSDTCSDPEVVNVDNLLAAAVVEEHSNSVGGQNTGATWRTSELLEADGPPVVAHYDMSDTCSDPEVVNVDNLLAAAVVEEHSNSVGGQNTGATWRTSELLEAGHLDPGFLASDKTSVGNAPLNEEIHIASSDSEVEIVGVQEHARCVHPRGGVIQSVSSWKHGSGTQYVGSRQTPSWTAVTPQQTWASPAEVVDLTLDEDSRQFYLVTKMVEAVYEHLVTFVKCIKKNEDLEKCTFLTLKCSHVVIARPAGYTAGTDLLKK